MGQDIFLPSVVLIAIIILFCMYVNCTTLKTVLLNDYYYYYLFAIKIIIFTIIIIIIIRCP